MTSKKWIAGRRWSFDGRQEVEVELDGGPEVNAGQELEL